MPSEKNDYTPQELIELLDKFEKTPNHDNALILGVAIATSSDPIDIKKRLFSQAFDVVENSEELTSILNAWAVAVMLEDDIPISQKILAVRGMIKDPHLDMHILEEWVKFVWAKQRVPKDMRDFIAIDFRNDARVSNEVKKLLV